MLSTPQNKKFSNDTFISLRGVKEHNLKNFNLDIPRETLTVITGLSGSGKSSLAFDTIFAEGQRRYVESLSTFARQFLEVFGKPNVESIDGLSPTISIQQKTTSHNPRSTVGTVTEIYDFMRLLFARVAKPYCYNCEKPIFSQTTQQMVDNVLQFPAGTQVHILAPIVRDRKGEYQKELLMLQQKGFSRVRIDGETLELNQEIALDKNKKHTIDVYIDRLVVRDHLRGRLQEAFETASKLADGLVKIEQPNAPLENRETLFSEKFSCITCGISYPAAEPRTFSFNSSVGACSHCSGLGYQFNSLNICSPCLSCQGKRLKQESLYFKIHKKNIAALSELSIKDLYSFFILAKWSDRELLICERILHELKERLNFLVEVGVGYISLNRPVQTLSGGESQRIRLATQIGSSLTGVIYVLDEPSIGLHQRDNQRLLSMLEKLRDMGNTVLVVEHDEETIRRANHIIDLGPKAGTNGGFVVAQGTLHDIFSNPQSLTGQYLSKKQKIEIPSFRKPIQLESSIILNGVCQNNLKNVDTVFPLGLLICVTGVSGSGKSTLIIDTLYPLLMHHLYKTKIPPLKFYSISGHEKIDKVVDINQSPIGRTPRSNPATYTGISSIIRDLFAQLPESRMRGFNPGRFSFNTKGGRCENCSGNGLVRIEMHFLSEVYVCCEHCKGKRFNEETLAIKYKSKSIADIFEMTVLEAVSFFENIPSLERKLRTLKKVGLGYMTLGQSATTLSGGEAQRMKLSRELSRRATGKTLYILDEPTTGLHFDDIRQLIEVLHHLVNQGNTVIVIEHNLEIIKTADYIIDLGPEGGDFGGKVLAQGTPEEISKNPQSHTGYYLKELLPS